MAAAATATATSRAAVWDRRMLEAKNHKGFDVADWPLAGWSPPSGLRPDLSPPHHLVMRSTSQGVGCMHVQGMVGELILTIWIALARALLGCGAVHISAKIPMRRSYGASDRWRDSARTRKSSAMVD